MESSLAYLYDLLGRNRIRIALLSVLVSLYSLSGLAYALLFRGLADSAISGSAEGLRRYAWTFLAVLFAQSLLSACIRRMQEITGADVENLLKKKLLENIFVRSYSDISLIHTGEWLNKFGNDISLVSRNAVHLLPNFCSVFVHILVSIAVLTDLVPGLVRMMLGLVLIALIFEFFFYRRIKVLHKEVQEKDGLLRVFLQECISSLMMIRSYEKEEAFLNAMDEHLDAHTKAKLRRNLFSVIMNFFFGTGINGALILSSIYCAGEIIHQRISYGTFVAVIQIITLIRNPVTNIYSSIPNYYSMIGSIERIREAETYPAEEKGKSINLRSYYENDFEKIVLENLSFEYLDNEDRRKVIRDLSFEIEKGSFTGISGPSGCGKSTLFKLMLGLYRPISGEILIDDHRLDASFRGLFAYVPQENLLMRGSIRDVICFGEEYDVRRFDEALENACCREFVDWL